MRDLGEDGTARIVPGMNVPGNHHRVGSIFEREIPENALIALEAQNGLAGIEWRVVVREVWGGRVECESEVLTQEGFAERVFKVSAKRLAAFWEDVEALDCWNLADRSDQATDLTGYEVFLRHGARTLRISCYGFLGDSPQSRLVRRIERMGGIDALFRRAKPTPIHRRG